MIKLDLYHECKEVSISTNQYMWYTTWTNWRIKIMWSSQKMQKHFWQNATFIYNKGSQQSGYRGNIPQHNKGHIGQIWGFPSSSAGKESTCNAGDPLSISWLGRSSGEGTGYPLQYSRASLVAQTLKNMPAMWETWVSSLPWEDPLKKGTANHSNILALEFHGHRPQSMEWQRVGHDWATFTFMTDLQPTSYSMANSGKHFLKD